MRPAIRIRVSGLSPASNTPPPPQMSRYIASSLLFKLLLWHNGLRWSLKLIWESATYFLPASWFLWPWWTICTAKYLLGSLGGSHPCHKTTPHHGWNSPSFRCQLFSWWWNECMSMITLIPKWYQSIGLPLRLRRGQRILPIPSPVTGPLNFRASRTRFLNQQDNYHVRINIHSAL
jgi:hypothetical protein